MEKGNYEMQMKLLFVKENLLFPLYCQQTKSAYPGHFHKKSETTEVVPPVMQTFAFVSRQIAARQTNIHPR